MTSIIVTFNTLDKQAEKYTYGYGVERQFWRDVGQLIARVKGPLMDTLDDIRIQTLWRTLR